MTAKLAGPDAQPTWLCESCGYWFPRNGETANPICRFCIRYVKGWEVERFQPMAAAARVEHIEEGFAE